MVKLRLASKETKRIDLGDGDYLDVRKELSKDDYHKLLVKMPEDFGQQEREWKASEIDDFMTALFATYVTAWSLPVPPTVENYLELERGAATVVDSAISSSWNEEGVSDTERTKSEGDSEEPSEG
jgi:hypothetical protein